jgi:hypothetical protein
MTPKVVKIQLPKTGQFSVAVDTDRPGQDRRVLRQGDHEPGSDGVELADLAEGERA